jgi:predicted DNA-binding protein (MmcQ/YjbR family)
VKKPNLLERMRSLCLSLPDTEESSRLGGSPHFYVNGKIFAGCGEEDGEWGFGCKVGLELQSLLVQRPGFRIAKYVGRYGWIDADEAALQDDDELERLVLLSYELITGKGGSVCSTKPAAKKKARKVQKVAKARAKTPPAKKRGVRAARGRR